MNFKYLFITLKITLYLFTVFLILSLTKDPILLAENYKGLKVVKTINGKNVILYKESHALIIGISNYIAGWPRLESVTSEIQKVDLMLNKIGFNTTLISNPNSEQLYTAFKSFINRYGLDSENRLLIFYSGHGHSRNNGKKGYIVPIDAPVPQENEKEFVRKAISMDQIITWSKRIEAKHALFVFDSCFSGTIFKTKSLPEHPPHISDKTSRPVRQYITAGSSGEVVPARSVFTPSFIRALSGEGDMDNDGYVTGTELGLYLHKKVMSYSVGQHPQYGKIKDPDLDEGDFVFIIKSRKDDINIDTLVDSKFDDPLYSQKDINLKLTILPDNNNTVLRINGREYDNREIKFSHQNKISLSIINKETIWDPYQKKDVNKWKNFDKLIMIDPNHNYNIYVKLDEWKPGIKKVIDFPVITKTQSVYLPAKDLFFIKRGEGYVSKTIIDRDEMSHILIDKYGLSPIEADKIVNKAKKSSDYLTVKIEQPGKWLIGQFSIN